MTASTWLAVSVCLVVELRSTAFASIISPASTLTPCPCCRLFSCLRFDGSTIGTAAPTSPNKIWWTQAEALLGLDWLAKQTGNTAYKSQLQQTLTFIRSHLLDREHGEWYWMVGPGGGGPLGYSAGGVDFAGTVKGNAWKGSYHTGRALLRLAQAGY
jgi:hypothetical protein